MNSIVKTTSLAAAFAVAAVAGSAQAQDSYEWRMATGWGGGPLMDIGAQAFADRLELLSDGRMKVEVFQGGAIGEPLKVTDSVRRGIADMGHTWPGYDWGRDTTAVVFGGFAGTMDDERMMHWLYEGGGVELWKEWRQEEFGVVGMPLFSRTAEIFLNSRKKVQTLEDLEGLKMRTAGAWIDMSKELGASPVTTAGDEIYPMLERGVIDATEWGTPWEDTYPKFYEVTDYIIVPGVHQPVAPFELQVNQEVWDSLSERDRELIETAAELTTLKSWMRVGHESAEAMRFFEEEGLEIVELDTEVQVKAREIGIEWAGKQAAENEWFKRAWESQREFEKLWADAETYRRLSPETRSIGLDAE